MSKKNILKIFEDANAIITNNHFVYTSGKHGPSYVNKDAIYPYIDDISYLCREIALNFIKEDIDTVIAPAVGGIILSQWVAHHLNEFVSQPVYAVYAEKNETDGTFVIKRGYDKFISNLKVLVVEDILTTGGSVKKVIDAVRKNSGRVVGVGALCNRGGIIGKDLDVPKLISLLEVPLEMYEEADCPLCKTDVPINVEVGKGREYMDKKLKA